MTDAEKTALAERASLRTCFALFAMSREVEAAASGDARYDAAADSIKRIEATLDQITDAALLRLATVNLTSDGGLSMLIGARLDEVGFALPLYADAASFLQPVIEQVDAVLDRARPHLH